MGWDGGESIMESMGGEHTWRATCLPLNGLCFLFRMGGAYDFDGFCFRLPMSDEAGKSRSSSTYHTRKRRRDGRLRCTVRGYMLLPRLSVAVQRFLAFFFPPGTGSGDGDWQRARSSQPRRSQPSSSRRLQKPKPSKSFITALRQYSQAGAAAGSAVRRCSARPWHLVLRAVAKGANYGAPGACGLLGWMLLAGTPMLDSGVHLMQYSAYHPGSCFFRLAWNAVYPLLF